MRLLSQLYPHGFQEHTENISTGNEPLIPVERGDELTLSGHWQASEIKLNYIYVLHHVNRDS